MGGAISVYKYGDGRLDSIQRISSHVSFSAGDCANADIHISPDGLFLYASNRDDNTIAIFSINQSAGILTHIGYQPVCGNHPRIFSLNPSGKFLLVANQLSGNVVVFKRDLKTGLLQKAGRKIKIRGASCVQIKNYND